MRLSVKIIIGVVVLIFSIGFLANKIIDLERESTKQYFSKFNHSFSGIVEKYTEDDGIHQSTIFIKLISSEIDNYSSSEESNWNFLSIENGVAKINSTINYTIQRARSTKIQKGDSLAFDGIGDVLYWYRESALLGAWQPKLHFTRDYEIE